MDIGREECRVYIQGGRQARDFEYVEKGIRVRQGFAYREFFGMRADPADADSADAGRVPGGAGGADGESDESGG